MCRRYASWIHSFDRKTQIRLRGTLFGAVDYALNAAFLFGFAATGAIGWHVPVVILLLSLALNIGFVLAIAGGHTRGHADPSLTGLQILAACALNLVGLVLAPQLLYLFVLNFFLPLSFSTFHFGRRAFVVTWLLLSAALGAVMIWTGVEQPASEMLHASRAQGLLFWCAVVTIFGRFLAVNANVSALRARLKFRAEELAEETSRIGALTSRDPVTGLWNRREFLRLLQDESRRAVRNKTSFCVALIEVDHYEAVRSRQGDDAAGMLLHDVAQSLELGRRATDSLARVDANRFAMLLPGARISTATVALERTRGQLLHQLGGDSAAQAAEDTLSGNQFSISVGVAPWKPGEVLADVLARAETALAEAREDPQRPVRAAAFPA